MIEVYVECPICDSNFYEHTGTYSSGVLDTCCNECGSDLSIDFHVEAYTDGIVVVVERRQHEEDYEEDK